MCDIIIYHNAFLLSYFNNVTIITLSQQYYVSGVISVSSRRRYGFDRPKLVKKKKKRSLCSQQNIIEFKHLFILIITNLFIY